MSMFFCVAVFFSEYAKIYCLLKQKSIVPDFLTTELDLKVWIYVHMEQKNNF